MIGATDGGILFSFSTVASTVGTGAGTDAGTGAGAVAVTGAGTGAGTVAGIVAGTGAGAGDASFSFSASFGVSTFLVSMTTDSVDTDFCPAAAFDGMPITGADFASPGEVVSLFILLASWFTWLSATLFWLFGLTFTLGWWLGLKWGR